MPRIQVATEAGKPVEMHYEDYGSGQPVVLIHGWPLSGRSWEPQVPALVAAGFRVIAIDRRGFGQSSQPWSGYDYDTFTSDLDALLQSLDLRAATLVGFSMGGGEVARYIGSRGTGRIARAVFAAAVPPYLYKTKDNPEGGLDDPTIRSFQEGIRNDRIGFLDGFMNKFFSANGKLMVSEAQRKYACDIAAFASPKGTLDCIAAFACTDFRADLEKCKLPALVIHGDSDGIVPFEVSGARTVKSVAGAKLHLVKGAPHGFNLSHAEEFNRTLIEFLKT